MKNNNIKEKKRILYEKTIYCQNYSIIKNNFERW